jgi:glycosyltransferase involved in cell wall biosynthesis
MQPSAEPVFTIITVSLNNRAGLEKTIRSVIAQQHPSVEQIIADGGSTDGSDNLKEAYGSHIAHWISEPDRGPYDGMNRGIRLAKGKWTLFLNAGDVFFDAGTLNSVMEFMEDKEIDALYGDSIADYNDFRIYRKAGGFEDIWKGMVFSHQAVFMKTGLLKENPFNLEFRIIADYELMLRCLRQPARVRQIPFPLAVCDASGISNRGQAKILCQYYRQAEKYGLLTPVRKLHYFSRYIILAMIDLGRNILPERIYLSIIKVIKMKDSSTQVLSL